MKFILLKNINLYLFVIASLFSFFCSAQSSLLQPCEENKFKDKCYGEIKYDNGGKYIGEFINDKPEGRGVASYSSGAKYIGEFIGGFRNGEGTYYYPNGNVYRGQWQRGKRNGEGVLSLASGGTKKGIWSDGELLQPPQLPAPINQLEDPVADASVINSTPVCSSVTKLILNSSGYNGNIEVQLRSGNRPGSKVIRQGVIFTSGIREFNGICPDKYFFSFATSDSPTVSVTSYFIVEQNTSIAEMTVFLSRSKTSQGNKVQVISKKDL
jgi:hypothetical protein